MRVCPDCNKVVSALDSVEIKGKYFHKKCRTCVSCGHVITDQPEYFNNEPYHFHCLYSSKPCCVCGKYTAHYVMDFWGNIACTEHGDICKYCGRIISPKTNGGHISSYSYIKEGVKIVRDEHVCGLCSDTFIKTTEDIERCRKEVFSVFHSNGIDGIPEDIPIILSDMVQEREKMGNGLWGLNHSHISASRKRYSCEITIHNNLPELLFKGVLAHELLHSWLSLYAINLPEKEQEGFCNLGKYLILRQYKTKDAEFLISWALEDNKDPIYGDGYRLMKMRLDKLGWKGLMDAILWENKTPVHIEL